MAEQLISSEEHEHRTVRLERTVRIPNSPNTKNFENFRTGRTIRTLLVRTLVDTGTNFRLVARFLPVFEKTIFRHFLQFAVGQADATIANTESIKNLRIEVNPRSGFLIYGILFEWGSTDH